MATERLYLYALTRRDKSWSYVGATIHPRARARKWKSLHPRETFKVLMIGDESYVLKMERDLIRTCKQSGIPIRNNGAKNVPVAVLRVNGRKGALRIHELYPDLARENARKTGLKFGSKGGRRVHELHPDLARANGRFGSMGGRRMHELHPDLARQNGRKAAHATNHRNRHIVKPDCPFCIAEK